jgi:hypothetical protein
VQSLHFLWLGGLFLSSKLPTPEALRIRAIRFALIVCAVFVGAVWLAWSSNQKTSETDLTAVANSFLPTTPTKPFRDPQAKPLAEPLLTAEHAPLASETTSTLGATTSRPFDAPTVEEYRADVLRDPHGTPPSLVRFAAAFALMEKEAKSSLKLRKALAEDLARCTINSKLQLASSARSFCLLRLGVLAKSEPEHFEKTFQYTLSLTPDVLALRSSTRGLQ